MIGEDIYRLCLFSNTHWNYKIKIFKLKLKARYVLKHNITDRRYFSINLKKNKIQKFSRLPKTLTQDNINVLSAYIEIISSHLSSPHKQKDGQTSFKMFHNGAYGMFW